MPTKIQLETRVNELEQLLAQNGISQGTGSFDLSGSVDSTADDARVVDYELNLTQLQAKLSASDGEVERLQTQLAGVSVAAFGGTSEPVVAKQGDWGWSVAYQDVLNLRIKYDELLVREESIMDQCRKLGEQAAERVLSVDNVVIIDGKTYPIMMKRSARFVDDEVRKHHIDENYTAVIIERYGD